MHIRQGAHPHHSKLGAIIDTNVNFMVKGCFDVRKASGLSEGKESRIYSSFVYNVLRDRGQKKI